MSKVNPKSIALGGVLASLAVVIMCLGGLIPIATYVCPVLCMVLLCWVSLLCGSRIGWAWYGAVSILSVLLGPDKEAAVLFVFLGYYPILKPKLDKLPCSRLFKLLVFNTMILAAYGLLIYILGMDQIAGEFKELGAIMTAVTLVMGNGVMLVLDVVLLRIQRMVRRN